MRKSASSKVKESTQVSKKLHKSAPAKLLNNPMRRKNIVDKLVDHPDLKDVFANSLNKEGVLLAVVSKRIAATDVQGSFVANSTRFKFKFVEDINIIDKNKHIATLNININSYKSRIQTFLLFSRTHTDGAIMFNNRLLEIIELVPLVYQNYLQKFVMTYNYNYIFNLCDILTELAKTLIEYNDYNTRNTEFFEGVVNPYIHVGHAHLTARGNRSILTKVVNFTRPYLDKYVFLAYEYNKFCLVYYIKNKSKSSNKQKLLVLVKNIIDLHIYNKKMYPYLAQSKPINIDNDRICFMFLKYYFEGISRNTFTPYIYRHLQQFTAQTVFGIPQIQYEDFIKDTTLHDELFNKCIEFIVIRKGIAYELANTSRFNKLNLKFTNLPPV